MGLASIVMMDIGFDMINCFSKSFVLGCTPRDQHTSVLVLAMVTASAGGLSTALAGLVDFSKLLDLTWIEG